MIKIRLCSWLRSHTGLELDEGRCCSSYFLKLLDSQIFYFLLSLGLHNEFEMVEASIVVAGCENCGLIWVPILAC